MNTNNIQYLYSADYKLEHVNDAWIHRNIDITQPKQSLKPRAIIVIVK